MSLAVLSRLSQPAFSVAHAPGARQLRLAVSGFLGESEHSPESVGWVLRWEVVVALVS